MEIREFFFPVLCKMDLTNLASNDYIYASNRPF